MDRPEMDDYWSQSRDPTNAVLLVIPLLVAYEIGLVASGFRGLNGVDLITVFVVGRWGVEGLLLFNAALIGAGLCVAAVRHSRAKFEPAIIVPTCAESFIYAFLLGGIIIGIMQWLPIRPGVTLAAAEAGRSIGEKLVASIGAGVNEEIVFRAGLYGGLWALARRRGGLGPVPAFLGAALVSSVAFSAAHHLAGEPFTGVAFVYRLLAGVIFCIIYQVRGLAVAVYTHSFYDILVLVFGS